MEILKLNNNNSEIYLYNSKIKKNSTFNMWFYFPGPESFAMSSLGYLWLYKEIDEDPDIDIERVYSDSKTTRIMSKNIDLIGVSMSFDMDFLAILKFLEKNNYSYKTSERGEESPLIYAGGPVITANPEPYKNLFDFMVLGDGEGVNIQIVKTICIAKEHGATKKEILKLLNDIEGVYVPSLPRAKVTKLTKRLSNCIYTPILSERAFFPNTFIMEVERGCANRCGFCLASYINLPIRFPSYEKIIETIDIGLSKTNRIALLGAQVTAHPKFLDILKYVEKRIDNGENIFMSISSLRVDSFKEDVIKILKKAGQKNLTLAIEGGSERLRRVVNKNITEEQILNAIDTAVKCGLNGLKIYAMIGIPTETQEDIDSFITLTKKIKKQHKGFELSYGFSTFVPKANTPFQWYGRNSEKELEKKSKYLKKELHKLGVQVNISSPKWDYYQAVLSRGDENLTDYLIKVYELGGKIGAFKKASKDLKINTNYYAEENYDYDKPLPWDFIKLTPEKDFLIQEIKRLINI